MTMRTYRRLLPLGPMAILAGLGAAAPTAVCQEPGRGQALYENHCQSCHEEGARQPGHRRASSLEDLRARVAAWSIHAGLGWGPEEIEDVTGYLNRRFYRFGD